MNLSGNTIFIAGATSGIGRGLAERFADAGNHVIIAGRRQHLVDEIVAARCGPKLEVHARHAAPDDGSRLA
jgi:uncharacterized oxidoreductase